MFFWQISGNYAIFQTHLDLLDLILGRIAHFSLEKVPKQATPMAMPSSLAWYQGACGEKAGITPSSELSHL